MSDRNQRIEVFNDTQDWIKNDPALSALFFATPKYLKLQNAFPKVAAGNSSFLHVSPA